MTIKNHYIPCFWAAYWNFDYLNSKRTIIDHKDIVREKTIFVLNLRINKILKTTTENVFFEKKSGIAKVTPDTTLDFENIFSIMEEAYKDNLESVILSNKIIDEESKALLTSFIVYQTLRHPNMLNSMTEFYKTAGLEKYQMLLSLKAKLSNPNEMLNLFAPILVPKWTIYKLNKNVFPLSDCPILGRNKHLMIALAPNIMLEIFLDRATSKIEPCIVKNRISYFKYRKFIRRTIYNSSREIIFGSLELLEDIQKSCIYSKHLKKVKWNVSKSSNRIV